MSDGSAVSAKVSARAAGAAPGDIPLLKLDATAWNGSGKLNGITTIQRLNTHGGSAEGACDSSGAFLSVPYSADYTFYRNAGQSNCTRDWRIRCTTTMFAGARTAPSTSISIAGKPPFSGVIQRTESSGVPLDSGDRSSGPQRSS